MNVSNIRTLVMGAACAALMLAPAVAATSDTAATTGGQNLSDQAQQEATIPLPSFAPLADRVLPAVVNIFDPAEPASSATGPEQ